MTADLQTLMVTHPVLKLPGTRKEAAALVTRLGGQEAFVEWLKKRYELIQLEKVDPLHYGFEPECWKDARGLLGGLAKTESGNGEAGASELLVQGGNRAGKTEWAGKYTVEALLAKEGARVWCLHSSNQSSVAMQQPIIYKYLPPELRDLGKKGRVANVCYTQKNGFSENTFVLPSGSQCWFMNYMQDPKVIEGGELDLIWCDELVPYDWVETLRYRLVTRRGKLIITFTAIEGYSLVVKDYVAGARIVKALPSPLLPNKVNVPGCPRGTMPYILQPPRASQRVIYFFTEFNPFNPYGELVKALEGRPCPEVKVRAYGWADKLIGNAFPKFGDVHVVAKEAVPKAGTNYLVVDPGGSKNWFMLWLRVDVLGRIFVYREWPDASLGEWALPSEKADGKAGPAQRAESGRGILGYKALMLELEGAWYDAERGWVMEEAEEIFERLIDPRAGSAAVPGKEEGTSIIELMLEPNEDKEGKEVAPPMLFVPSPACRVDEGSTLINDLLDYNPEQPVTVLNAPRLYVWEGCRNLIFALREWTGIDGEKGACKDPVDCLKYAAKRGLEFVDGKAEVCRRGGSY